MACDKGPVDTTDDFLVEDAPVAEPKGPQGRETDPHRIAQRQKQIDLGKNTVGYQRSKRRRRVDPATPDVHQLCSKRGFDGQVKKWRRELHSWDQSEEDPPAVALKEGSVEPASSTEAGAEAQTETGLRDGRAPRSASPLLPTLLGRKGEKRGAESPGEKPSGDGWGVTSTGSLKHARITGPQPAADELELEVDCTSAASEEVENGWMKISRQNDWGIDEEASWEDAAVAL